MPDHRVADACQAGLLLDTELRPLLILLMNQAWTVSHLAAQLGLSLNQAYYRLRKLLEAGIAEVEHVEQRSGWPLKYYRAHASWFIPFEVTRLDSLANFAKDQMLPRFEQMIELGTRVVEQHSQGNIGYWMDATSVNTGDEQRPFAALWHGDEPFFLGTGSVTLSRARATEFKQRLLHLLEEFAPQDLESASRYAVRFVFVRGQVD